MSFHSNSNPFLTQEVRSKGGKARAAKLSPEKRKEIAIKASHSRWNLEGLPKATHTGPLIIADIKISCAVLENGKRVITQASMNSALGRSNKNPSTLDPQTALLLPNFLVAENIKSFIDKDLKVLANPIVLIKKGESCDSAIGLRDRTNPITLH